jgi:general secretion pathway protein A
LTALDDANVELLFNGSKKLLARDDVADLWFGQYLLVWRPPNGSAGAIAPGMQNINVLWLRESLAQLGLTTETTSVAPEFFDSELEAQLREFQRQNRLQIDGLAGQQTQIVINSMLAPEGGPRLSGSN